jgi:methylenetetrahydrofolate dehydrogenase (NADP+)/methenyltetrahydrofolate cyclohydrolase
MLLDGKKYAEAKVVDLKSRVKDLAVKPSLAIIQVSGNPASDKYVQNKLKRCSEIGILPKLFYCAPDIKQSQIEETIKKLNKDPGITGIILQLPLPDHLDEHYLTNLIDPKKDVDGFTETNTGKLSLGQPCLIPCTPKGIIDLLDFYDIPMEGKDVLIINRSNIVGKPLAQLFLQRNATVTVAHSKTQNLKQKLKQADIIVTGVGIPNFLRYDDFPQGATIIDVSINFVHGKMCGDVNKNSYDYLEKIGNLTPVPGGVGQSTVIALMENVVKLAEEEVSMYEERVKKQVDFLTRYGYTFAYAIDTLIEDGIIMNKEIAKKQIEETTVTIDASTYQKTAARTINKDLYPEEIEMHALHGMAGEIGELHSLYQKSFQGHKFDEEHAKKELGDLLWFIAEYCTVMNWDLADVMLTNLGKLAARFPDGFEAEKSLNRDPKDI